MTIEERRTQVTNLITDARMSPLEKLESIERLYLEPLETILVCFNAASAASEHGVGDDHFNALNDAAGILIYTIGDREIVVTEAQQKLLREAQEYVAGLEDRDD